MKLYTIGHSTRPLADFIGLLEREGIEHVVDVRTHPGSRRYPQYNREALRESLTRAGVEYSHEPALGGRRTPRADSENTGLRNSGFRGYADHMESNEFRGALDALLTLARDRRVAIMCAEAVPWRCHRSLISDAAAARGVEVLHILDAATGPHRYSSAATVSDGLVRYPAAASSTRSAQSDAPELFDSP